MWKLEDERRFIALLWKGGTRDFCVYHCWIIETKEDDREKDLKKGENVVCENLEIVKKDERCKVSEG